MPKLTNGRIDTATMIRLLMRHADDEVPWTASAPRTYKEGGDGWAAMEASVHHKPMRWVAIGYPDPTISTGDAEAVPDRSDWTIHRPPHAKPKPSAPSTTVHLGTVTLGTSGAVKTSAGDERVMDELFALPDGEWVVEARRKR